MTKTIYEMIQEISMDDKHTRQIIGVYICGFVAGTACKDAGLPNPVDIHAMKACYKAISLMLENTTNTPDFEVMFGELKKFT